MSNVLGTIKGNVKHGKSSILINSNTVEISGNLSANGRIDFFSSNEELAASDATGILSKIDNLDNSLNSLLTSNNDASFNNVDVSGSLNVQGEKVITVPSLDICGNDLSANTTYEITTGPPGSINNISFKTGKHHGSMRFMPGTSIANRKIVRQNVTGRAAAVNFDTNHVYYTTDTEFEPVYGMAAKYTPVGVTVHTDQMVDTNGNNVSFSGGHPSRFRIARSGYYRLVVNLTVQDESTKYRQNLMMFRRSGSNTANGYRVGTTSDLIGLQIQFNSNEQEVKQLIFNDICALSEGDEVYPCYHMNQNGVDMLYIDMNTYFNIEEI